MTEVHFKDGDMVKEGDLLFKIDDRQYKADLERNEGNKEQIEAHTNRLEKEYRRAKTLLARGQISQEEYDRYESDFRETEANLKLAKANCDLAKLNYEWCEVRASASGRLSRRLVDPGNLVKADDTVLTSIVSLDPMYVYFFVNEQVMKQIQQRLEQAWARADRRSRRLPVQISFSDEGDDEFPHRGIVDFTDNKEVNESRTLRFRAKLDNKDHFIVPGMVVRVRLPIGDPHPAVFIRERALVTDQGEKGVYVDSRARRARTSRFRTMWTRRERRSSTTRSRACSVRSGRRSAIPASPHDGLVEIKDGVQAGDWVVVSGMQRLKNDKVVQAEKYSQGDPATKTDASDGRQDSAKPRKRAKAAQRARIRPAGDLRGLRPADRGDGPGFGANRGRVRSDLLGRRDVTGFGLHDQGQVQGRRSRQSGRRSASRSTPGSTRPSSTGPKAICNSWRLTRCASRRSITGPRT